MSREFTGLPHDLGMVNSIAEQIYPLYSLLRGFPQEVIHTRGVCQTLSAEFHRRAEQDAGYYVETMMNDSVPGKISHYFNRVKGILGEMWVVDLTWQQFIYPAGVGIEEIDPSLPKVLLARQADLPNVQHRLGIPQDLHSIWANARVINPTPRFTSR